MSGELLTMSCLFLSDLGDSIKGFHCTRLGHDIQISNQPLEGIVLLLVLVVIAMVPLSMPNCPCEFAEHLK